MQRDSDESTTRPLPIRHPSVRAALPVLYGDTRTDLTTLHRLAVALREPDGGRRARPGIPADIARLRRDMGDAIATMWATPAEVVRYAC